jgi:Zn finger protein HypA/HybF involved in hydrogenase expression
MYLHFQKEGGEVTVTITGIPKNKGWWYMSCSKCPNKVTLESTAYKCTQCGLTTHTFR